ncbi:trypsin-like serine peptidase [Kitasatospora sp. NPDC127111]|uniref:trypsin-like serine peptidase n=1 Tax=Kitasatospora sp. NPDC127111 TaxID=3345363 RepID=UPI0036277CED
MSPISRTTRAALGASVVALTMVVATACGPENDDPAGAQTAAPTAAATTPGKPGAAPIKLPTAEELKTWKFEDWDKWAQQNVITPAVKGFWDLKKILEAKPSKPKPPAQPTGQPTAQPTSAAPAQPTQPPAQPTAQPPAGDNGNDPLPKVVEAKAVPHPFAKNFHVNGKIFSQHEDGNYYECSGTVVSDPAHPGKSNLVWTASHCVHGGKGAGYYKNLMFAPAFNSNGVLSGGKQATLAQAEPYGEWSMTDAIASPQWPAEADHKTGGPWSQYDFAIVRVENPNGGDKSLEETVGGSVPVWFNAPRDQLTAVSDYGYPADAPFDGMELEHCDGGKPVRLSMDVKRPPMLTIGCNMTPGDSGGGWFATKDGKQVLVSDVSIGDGTWEAGPYLDDVAAKAMDYFSKKKK